MLEKPTRTPATGAVPASVTVAVSVWVRAERVFGGLWCECDRGLVRKPALGGRVLRLAFVLCFVFVRVDEGGDRVETAVSCLRSRTPTSPLVLVVSASLFWLAPVTVKLTVWSPAGPVSFFARAITQPSVATILTSLLGYSVMLVAGAERQRLVAVSLGSPTSMAVVVVGVGEGGDRFGAREVAGVGAVRLAVGVGRHDGADRTPPGSRDGLC